MGIRIDLVMWVKNGEPALPLTLSFIKTNIPQEEIESKIAVDDGSKDNSKQILMDFGWKVVANNGSGIGDATNTALSHVKSEIFMSVEQDLLISKRWHPEVYPMIKKNAVASGIRKPSKPAHLTNLQDCVTENYKKKHNKSSFLYGKSLDNTVYRTDSIREIGGFPKLKINAGVDTALAVRLEEHGLNWAVNFDVQSTHLRMSLWDELKHYYWYGSCYPELKRELGNKVDDLGQVVVRTLISPARAVPLALSKLSPEILCTYPLIRFCTLIGLFRGDVKKNE